MVDGALLQSFRKQQPYSANTPGYIYSCIQAYYVQDIMASLGATATDAQQLAAGDQQPPIQPGTSAALEEVAQGAALEAGKALLKHVRRTGTHRTTISQPICRPNVHKVELDLKKAEEHLAEFFKLYEEAQDVRSCAEKDLGILAQAMRLHQQEPYADASERNRVDLMLQRLKMESENIQSGLVQPAAFVIRTGMTTSDIRGGFKLACCEKLYQP